MNILCAPDKFKGSLSAPEAAAAMAAGARRAAPHCTTVCLPLADGGEGTVEALVAACGGMIWPVEVRGPLGHLVEAFLADLGDGVFALEMSSASGLAHLRPEARDPLHAGTYGTGQLIDAALKHGARQIIVGAGGSASTDGGAGALQALGARLLDADGQDIAAGNAGLAGLERIDCAPALERLAGVTIRVANDVRNVLTGASGAAAVFGPQKGARPWDIDLLDRNLQRFAAIAAREFGNDVGSVPGSGAAGGLTAGLLLLGARMESGIDLVLDIAAFDRHLRVADLVLTGEGRIDGQSAGGKVISGVAARAAQAGVPVVALCGSVRGDQLTPLYALGLTAAFPILDAPASSIKAFARAATLVRRASESVVRLWLAARRPDSSASTQVKGD